MEERRVPQVVEKPETQSPFEREEDFTSLYANNVQFEQSVWDLKMIFGQLDQAKRSPVVEQHTAVTIPWIQAKLMSYFLRLHLDAYESANGKIKIPAEVRPVEPLPPSDELQGDTRALSLYELVRKRRQDFIAELEDQ